MNDLIERIEAASRPDRELEGTIWWLAGPGKAEWPDVKVSSALEACALIWGRDPKTVPPTWDSVGYGGPRYMTSIDAALTLVPEGWIVEIRRYFNSDGEYVASVQLVDSFSIGRGHDPDDEVSVSSRIVEQRQGIDPTPAAISAAALKARAYLKKTNNG